MGEIASVNEEQAQELHKPVIKKIKRRKVWQLCHKGPKVGAGDRVRITKYKKITSKAYTKNWSRKIFVIDSVIKTNLWTNKSKI